MTTVYEHCQGKAYGKDLLLSVIACLEDELYNIVAKSLCFAGGGVSETLKSNPMI
jgi:hypothetical protein